MFYKEKMMIEELERKIQYSYSSKYYNSLRGYKIFYLNPFENIVCQCKSVLNNSETFNIQKNNIILINICRLKTYLPELFDFKIPDPLQCRPSLALTLTPAYVLLRFGSVSESFTVSVYPENNHYGIGYEGLHFPGYQKIEDIVSFVKDNIKKE